VVTCAKEFLGEQRPPYSRGCSRGSRKQRRIEPPEDWEKREKKVSQKMGKDLWSIKGHFAGRGKKGGELEEGIRARTHRSQAGL